MKYHVEVFYRFKKKKTGVCLGMEVTADNPDDAIEIAKDQCVGPRWPSRIYSHASATESN
jgi:hypothetical protein